MHLFDVSTACLIVLAAQKAQVDMPGDFFYFPKFAMHATFDARAHHHTAMRRAR